MILRAQNATARRIGFEAARELVDRGEDPAQLGELLGRPGEDRQPPPDFDLRIVLVFLVRDRQLTLSEAIEVIGMDEAAQEERMKPLLPRVAELLAGLETPEG